MTGMSAAGVARRVQPGLIGRHDLVATLDCAVRKRVTIISAPAGSGKTSLLHAGPAGRARTRIGQVLRAESPDIYGSGTVGNDHIVPNG
jgi:hypothetical protein